MLKSSKANTLADELIDKTSSMLDEILSRIVHKEDDTFKYTNLVYICAKLSLDPKLCLLQNENLS